MCILVLIIVFQIKISRKNRLKKTKKKTIATLNNIQGQLKHPNKNFVD